MLCRSKDEIVRVASAFVDLRQHRHDADYNMGRQFTRVDPLDIVSAAERDQTVVLAHRPRSTGSRPLRASFLVAEAVKPRLIRSTSSFNRRRYGTLSARIQNREVVPARPRCAARNRTSNSNRLQRLGG